RCRRPFCASAASGCLPPGLTLGSCARALHLAPEVIQPGVAIVARVRRYLLLAVGYVGLVILANWLASRYVVSVGFGRRAPAGVLPRPVHRQERDDRPRQPAHAQPPPPAAGRSAQTRHRLSKPAAHSTIMAQTPRSTEFVALGHPGPEHLRRPGDIHQPGRR